MTKPVPIRVIPAHPESLSLAPAIMMTIAPSHINTAMVHGNDFDCSRESCRS